MYKEIWQVLHIYSLSLSLSLSPPAAQRSAQELPLVDKQSMESCGASGGEQVLLSGHNFQPDSKVVFVEKAQGRGHASVCVFEWAAEIVLKLPLFWEFSQVKATGTNAESQFTGFSQE